MLPPRSLQWSELQASQHQCWDPIITDTRRPVSAQPGVRRYVSLGEPGVHLRVAPGPAQELFVPHQRQFRKRRCINSYKIIYLGISGYYIRVDIQDRLLWSSAVYEESIAPAANMGVLSKPCTS